MPFRLSLPPLQLHTLGDRPAPAPFAASAPRPILVGRSVAPVVAYLNERGPSRGAAGLFAQLAAIRRRARRDGVPIQEMIVESGGATTAFGVGLGLARTAAAAACVPKPRVLYVADTRHLAADAASQLEALALCFAAGFEVRAPCGRIGPRGRRVAALRLAAAARAKTHAGIGPKRPPGGSEHRAAHAAGSAVDPRVAGSA